MSKQQTEVPYGTLDLLILKTLETLGTMHGYAIARRIEQVAGEAMQLSQGSVYPALIRLQQEGWIATAWGISETNRKVKFYSLTRSGRKQLLVEVARSGPDPAAGRRRDHGASTRQHALGHEQAGRAHRRIRSYRGPARRNRPLRRGLARRYTAPSGDRHPDGVGRPVARCALPGIA